MLEVGKMKKHTHRIDYASKNNISIVIRKEHMVVGKTELDISDKILKLVNEKIKEIK